MNSNLKQYFYNGSFSTGSTALWETIVKQRRVTKLTVAADGRKIEGGISTRSERWEKKGLMNNSYF